MPEPEERLWKAVVARLLSDSLAVNMEIHGGTRTVAIGRARAWLAAPTADRDEVLLLAGIDPDWWQDRVGDLLHLWPQIDQGRLKISSYGVRHTRSDDN